MPNLWQLRCIFTFINPVADFAYIVTEPLLSQSAVSVKRRMLWLRFTVCQVCGGQSSLRSRGYTERNALTTILEVRASIYEREEKVWQKYTTHRLLDCLPGVPVRFLQRSWLSRTLFRRLVKQPGHRASTRVGCMTIRCEMDAARPAGWNPYRKGLGGSGQRATRPRYYR